MTTRALHLPDAANDLVAQTRYFDFYRVNNRDLMAETHRLRYEVYCLERGFLPAQDYPDAQERDPFDGTAVHFLGRHRFTGICAGTGRLVLHSEQGFPMSQHCGFDDGYAYLANVEDARLQRLGEVSRLAVSRRYRQRADDTAFGGPPRSANAGNVTGLHASTIDYPATAGPEIVAGLYKCLYQEARLRGLTHFIVAMERNLKLLLRRMSIRFVPIGPERDYYGPVRPYQIPVTRLEVDMLKRHPEVLQYWLNGLPVSAWPLLPAAFGFPINGRANTQRLAGSPARHPLLSALG